MELRRELILSLWNFVRPEWDGGYLLFWSQLGFDRADVLELPLPVGEGGFEGGDPEFDLAYQLYLCHYMLYLLFKLFSKEL